MLSKFVSQGKRCLYCYLRYSLLAREDGPSFLLHSLILLISQLIKKEDSKSQ